MVQKGKQITGKIDQFFTQKNIDMSVYLPVALAVVLLLVSTAALVVTLVTPAYEEDSLPQVQYSQQGSFNYRVYLQPNSLFPQTELPPGQKYILDYLDSIPFTFNYQFSTDAELEAKTFTYRVLARIGAQELWKKEEVLIPTTTAEGDRFSVSFTPPLQDWAALIKNFDQQTGTNIPSPQIRLTVLVQPQVTTGYGPIQDPFEQTLAISLEGRVLSISEELSQILPGEITTTQITARPWVNGLRAASIAGILISLAVISLRVLSAHKRPSAVEQELRTAQKRLKGLLVETSSIERFPADQIVIHAVSLEELVGLAEETLHPIIFKRHARGCDYWLFNSSGSFRFEYHSRAGQEEAEAFLPEDIEAERLAAAAGSNHKTGLRTEQQPAAPESKVYSFLAGRPADERDPRSMR
ncbi:MAG: DUF5305 domain-containing protein [Chloroflexi bacterium]|nr:DUF5305 domain-containing protein [Chloroflexota bacterium]